MAAKSCTINKSFTDKCTYDLLGVLKRTTSMMNTSLRIVCWPITNLMKPIQNTIQLVTHHK